MVTESNAEHLNQNTFYQTENHEALGKALGIAPDEKILEVGGGGHPFKFAHVVVDIDFRSGHHRGGQDLSLDCEKYFIQADIQALPFQDKSFDWVICIQVLEHVNEPDKACEELMRVGRRGFLEVPRKWTEYYAGYPTHQWYIDEKDDVLLFEPIKNEDYPFMNFALPVIWRSPELYQRALFQYRHIPCIQLAWTQGFKYRIKTNKKREKVENRRYVASRHFNFANNLLYWLAPPDIGLYHAKRSTTLMPEIESYQDLYNFYLAANGRYREAWKNGLRVNRLIYSFLFRLSTFCFHYVSFFWQKKITTSPTKR